MESKVDAGDIILQSKVKITKFDTLKSLQSKVYKTEPKLILDAIKKLDSGDPYTKQNENDASIFPKRTPEDSEIDPNKTILELYDDIRACDPDNFPAFFYLDKKYI